MSVALDPTSLSLQLWNNLKTRYWTQTHCYVSTMHGIESQRSSSQDTLTPILAYHWQRIQSQKDSTGYIHTVMQARLIVQFALSCAAQYASARCQVDNCYTSYVHGNWHWLKGQGLPTMEVYNMSATCVTIIITIQRNSCSSFPQIMSSSEANSQYY